MEQQLENSSVRSPNDESVEGEEYVITKNIYTAMFDPKNKKNMEAYALCDSMISSEMEWLLYYLWHKESGKPVVKYNFKIPDTVIYKIGRPYAWYFTSKDGTIMKKTKAKLTNESVFESFTKKPNREVVATAYRINTSKLVSKITMEYLHKKDFKDFIYFNDENLHLEILQRFSVCKGKHNELIRCDWTPTINIVEKKTNPFLFDTPSRNSIYEKIVTYEGPFHMSKAESVVSSVLLNDINVACKFIADQLTSHNATLKHANFYFKLDDSDELVLVFANNFKIEPFLRVACGAKEIILTIPEAAKEALITRQQQKPDLDYYEYDPDAKKVRKGISTQITCPFCQRFIEKIGAYEFTLKFMLNILDFYHTNKLNSNNDDMKFSDESIPMYQIFNYDSRPNQDIAKFKDQMSSDEEMKGKPICS